MSEPTQFPAQPYGTPPAWGGQPHPPSVTAPETPPSGRATGRIAFILALAALAIGFLTMLSFPLVVRLSYDASAIGVFSAIGNGLVLIIAVVALILGLIAVKRSGSHVLAGIAIGVAAAEILGIVVSWMSNLFYALSY